MGFIDQKIRIPGSQLNPKLPITFSEQGTGSEMPPTPVESSAWNNEMLACKVAPQDFGAMLQPQSAQSASAELLGEPHVPWIQSRIESESPPRQYPTDSKQEKHQIA